MITIAPISKTKPSFSGLFGFLVINAVCCAWVVFRYKSKYKKVGVLPIRIVKSNVSSVGPSSERYIIIFRLSCQPCKHVVADVHVMANVIVFVFLNTKKKVIQYCQCIVMLKLYLLLHVVYTNAVLGETNEAMLVK